MLGDAGTSEEHPRTIQELCSFFSRLQNVSASILTSAISASRRPLGAAAQGVSAVYRQLRDPTNRAPLENWLARGVLAAHTEVSPEIQRGVFVASHIAPHSLHCLFPSLQHH